MRLATFIGDDGPRLGLVSGSTILDLKDGYARFLDRPCPASMIELIEGGAATRVDVDTVLEASHVERSHGNLWRDIAHVRLLSPIPRPRKNVVCVGRNYKLHIEEGARARGAAPVFPEVPEFFTKPPSSVIGPEEDIRLDTIVTKKLDYEVELAFIIGKHCRDVSAAEAADVIFGYTILNDVTARDLQCAHGQWFKGKALDSSCPIGPVIVTADEFGPPAGHALSLRVNGEPRQSSSTDDMLFDCAAIVASLSAGMTLEPGDIVTTGTPSGVGLGMSPQVWLREGDVVEAEIAGIGILRNTVRQVR
ncbi:MULTISPECIES: fumarylacetoacetate hydrolase family protein [unclassified Chelatococcus]|uniref:fumarylacetoacetate hydrolase family protein n=1 Tax=unclassified Chelatococcus TaxID=2638111 RepID=UPI001BCC8EF3|nr:MULTISPECIES: fumarylacetoacetate hydrolase family protein [unclassified Chelatococcus]MBS7700166.1 fumarylacetoacetate hydrolase family protein [Chelatococcus sp. YT9]MBX3556859.1 fumarylacetoacetate hydrolase family protein [Chelatococcus sp.]